MISSLKCGSIRILMTVRDIPLNGVTDRSRGHRGGRLRRRFRVVQPQEHQLLGGRQRRPLPRRHRRGRPARRPRPRLRLHRRRLSLRRYPQLFQMFDRIFHLIQWDIVFICLLNLIYCLSFSLNCCFACIFLDYIGSLELISLSIKMDVALE